MKKLVFCAIFFMLFACSHDPQDLLPEDWTGVDLGYLNSENEFLGGRDLPLSCGMSLEELKEIRYSKADITVKVELLKNERTKNADVQYADFWFESIDDKTKSTKLKINFYRNGETDSSYVFMTQTVKNGKYVEGKPILLVTEEELASQSDPDINILAVPLNLAITPRFQFTYTYK